MAIWERFITQIRVITHTQSNLERLGFINIHCAQLCKWAWDKCHYSCASWWILWTNLELVPSMPQNRHVVKLESISGKLGARPEDYPQTEANPLQVSSYTHSHIYLIQSSYLHETHVNTKLDTNSHLSANAFNCITMPACLSLFPS